MPPIQDDLSQLEADIANTPSEAATLAQTAITSLTALANLAKSLLYQVKTHQTNDGIPAPTVAAYEAEVLSQINAALAPMTQLKDVLAPLQTISATHAAIQEMAHAIENVDHSQTTIAPLTFEQQIEEAKTTE